MNKLDNEHIIEITSKIFDSFNPKTLTFIFLTFLSLKKLFNIFYGNYKHSKIIKLGQKHKESRDKKLEEFLVKYSKEITKDRRKTIISIDAHNLLKEIHSQRITSFEATLTYCLRSAEHGKNNNWITEVLFEEALNQSKLADEKIKKNKQNILPLEGLPISIKDCFQIKNYFSTIGLCSFVDAKKNDGTYKYLAKEDSILTEVLKEKGAIIFVKTNTPQNMIAIESTNNLWGSARNPWNLNKTCGGSSGGEGGLVAGHCSPIGIGTDIGGSIRIPAVYCGIYGFKPSSSRISRLGQVGINGRNFSSNLSISSSLGPMARSVDDIIFMMKHLFGSFTNDFYANNKPYDQNLFESIDPKIRKIKLAFIKDMFNCNIAPEIVETLNNLESKLVSQGYECVELKYDLNEINNLGRNLIINSGTAENLKECLGDEKPMKYYEKYLTIRNIPHFFLKLLNFFTSMKGNLRMSKLIESCYTVDQKTFFKNVEKFQELKLKFINYLLEVNIDAIICPLMPFYAPDIGTGEKAINYLDLSFFFNAVDMASGVLPIKLSEKDEYNSTYKDDLNLFLKQSVIKNMPICLQVATFHGKDEVSLSLMKQIDDLYKFDKNHLSKLIDKFN